MEKTFFTIVALVVITGSVMYTLMGLGWDEGRTNLMLLSYAISLVIAYIVARWALRQGWSKSPRKGVVDDKK